jgi:hypothetical protein
MEFYANKFNLTKMMKIINGESFISLRIVDWFVTNYSKKFYTIYDVPYVNKLGQIEHTRFKVYNDYKLKLKAYSKKLFDPFCRWDRITIPFDDDKCMVTTLGQLNFFKWAIENNIIEYIENYHREIENDMNSRNSTSKRKQIKKHSNLENNLNDDFISNEDIENNENDSHFILKEDSLSNGKTRKKREELSISACKCIKKETVKIVVKFN